MCHCNWKQSVATQVGKRNNILIVPCTTPQGYWRAFTILFPTQTSSVLPTTANGKWPYNKIKHFIIRYNAALHRCSRKSACLKDKVTENMLFIYILSYSSCVSLHSLWCWPSQRSRHPAGTGRSGRRCWPAHSWFWSWTCAARFYWWCLLWQSLGWCSPTARQGTSSCACFFLC